MGARVVKMAEVDSIIKAMLTLSRATERVLESSSVATVSGGPLGGSKIQVLRLLTKQGDQTPSQMARFLGVTKPAVSQIISAMHRSKLVSRKSISTDRREVYIGLTKRGKSAFQSIVREQRHLVRTALKHASTVDAKKWVSAMQSISTAISRADKTFEDYCLQCGAHADGTCVLQGGDADCLFLKHEKKMRSSTSSRGK